MRKLLLVAHGSPKKVNHDDFFKLASLVSAKLKDKVEISFIEHGNPSFDEMVEEIKLNPSITFFVQPVLMFPAGHMKKDIKGKLSSVKNAFVMPTLSENPYFLDFFVSYVRENLQTGFQDVLDGGTTPLFVFTGRGTSDPDGTSSFYAFSRRVWEKLGKLGDIEICFADVSFPRLSRVLRRTKLEIFDEVFIIPLIFFRGFVLEKLRKELEGFDLKKIHVFEPCGYYNPDGLAESIISLFYLYQKENQDFLR